MSVKYDHSKEIVPKKLIIPFALVTLCFALWGAANNMTDLLITVFKQVKGFSALEASLIQTAFYGAYFFAPIAAAFIISKLSYKSGAVIGLLLYACGPFLCYPASQMDSFTFFLCAFYVFAGGCAIVETSVAPFVLSMGPRETATQRINLAQAFNPVGSISGILLGKYVILSNLTPAAEMSQLAGSAKTVAQAHDLSFVVKAYAIVGVIGLIVGIVILIKKFPNIDSEEEHVPIGGAIKRLAKNKNYLSAVVAQFFYVGAQIGVWTFVVDYIKSANIGFNESSEAWWFYFGSIVAFLLARFICAALMKFFDPARLLSTFSVFACIFTVGVIFAPPMIGAVCIILVSACMSLMFPTIYSLGLLSTGDDKKIGGSGIIMAIVGGAILVPMQGFMNDGKLPSGDFILNVILRNLFTPMKQALDYLNFEYSTAHSYLMPLICFIVVAIYGFIAHKKEETSGIIHELNE